MKFFKDKIYALVPPVFGATASFGDLSGAPGIDLTIQGVFAIFVGLACWFSRIILVFMVIALIFYGLQMLTSRGNESKFTAAKKSLGYAVLGVIVILGAYTIITTIAYNIDPTFDYSRFIPLDCTSYE